MAYFEIIKKTPAEWTAANPILLDNEIGSRSYLDKESIEERERGYVGEITDEVQS